MSARSVPSSGHQSSSTSSSTVAPPNCQAPCALWTKAGGSDPEYVAISPDDSFIAVAVALANGSEVYALDDQGNTLWSHDLNHQISSITISSNGMYVAAGGFQIARGPAGVYDNGEVYLFSSGGNLLWSLNAGSGNPVFKVAISSDGSVVAADGEESVMYIDASTQAVLWSERTDGYTGMAMSADGSLVVMPSQSGSITAFNAQGAPLWSSPIVGSDDNIAVSSDGSRVWVGEAESGYNGTLSLFTGKGSLVWQREIYSPALSIQTGGNLTAFVSTNWGALLYGGDGSLLANLTSSAPAGSAGECNPPSFWYWSTNEAPVAFLDTQGNIVSSYNPDGFTVDAALSSDGSYAAVASQNGLSKSFSLAFVYLATPTQGCTLSVNKSYNSSQSNSSISQSTNGIVSTDASLVEGCPNSGPESGFGTVTVGTTSPALLCIKLYYYSATPLTVNLTAALSIQALQYIANGSINYPRSFSGASNFTVTASQSQLTMGGPNSENEGATIAYGVTAKSGSSGTYWLSFFESSGLSAYVLDPQEPMSCAFDGELVAGSGQPDYTQGFNGCITYTTTNQSGSTTSSTPSAPTVPGIPYSLTPGNIYFEIVGVASSTG
jgi:PQQ-like domain